MIECVPDERVENANDISMIIKMRAKVGYGLKVGYEIFIFRKLRKGSKISHSSFKFLHR
jgi:hypothetical protein